MHFNIVLTSFLASLGLVILQSLSAFNMSVRGCSIQPTSSCDGEKVGDFPEMGAKSDKTTGSCDSGTHEIPGEILQTRKLARKVRSMKIEEVPTDSLASRDVDTENFIREATCGNLRPMLTGTQDVEPTEEFDLSKMMSRVVVHRREMNSENELFCTIRNKTASVLALGYFGTYKQVCFIAHHGLRVFLQRTDFEEACKLLTRDKREVLVLLTITGILESATFSFPRTSKFTDPLIYKCKSTSKALYGIVYEYLLTPFNTTVRNVPGNVIEFLADSVALSGNSEHSLSSVTSVKLDVQQGARKRAGYLNKRKKLQTSASNRQDEFDQPQDYNLTRKIRKVFG